MAEADIHRKLSPVLLSFNILCRYGVGGEYPMAAGSAAERAESGGIQKARARGREVVLTFTMQVRPYCLLAEIAVTSLNRPALHVVRVLVTLPLCALSCFLLGWNLAALPTCCVRVM